MGQSDEILQEMLAADSESKRLVYEKDEEMLEFVKNCEKIYLKTTEKHLTGYKENELEGNVDEDRWYRFGKLLQKKGHVL